MYTATVLMACGYYSMNFTQLDPQCLQSACYTSCATIWWKQKCQQCMNIGTGNGYLKDNKWITIKYNVAYIIWVTETTYLELLPT